MNTANDESYTFDDNGNRLTASGASYSTGTNNQLLSDGTFTYTYDNEGNRLTKTRISTASADDYVVEYAWESTEGRRAERGSKAEGGRGGWLSTAVESRGLRQENTRLTNRNRLTGVTNKNNAGTVTKSVTLAYDHNNLLLGTSTSTGGSSFYAWDGNEILEVHYGYYSDVHYYLYGPGTDMVLFDDKQYTVTALLGDHLNTVRDVVNTSGAVENHVVFNAFGLKVSQTALTVVHVGFTGRITEIATGLQYNWRRWYDPAVGRWISEDPIGFAGGLMNLASYVGNQVTTYVDPSGLAEKLQVYYSSNGRFRVEINPEWLNEEWAKQQTPSIDQREPYCPNPNTPLMSASSAYEHERGAIRDRARRGTLTSADVDWYHGLNREPWERGIMEPGGMFDVTVGALGGAAGISPAGQIMRPVRGGAPYPSRTGRPGAFVKSDAPAEQRTLPRDKHGILEGDAAFPHTQLGRSSRSHGAEPRANAH